MPSKMCAHCGKEFTVRRNYPPQVYCCIQCRIRSDRERHLASKAFRQELGMDFPPLKDVPKKWEIHRRATDKTNP